MSTHSYYKAIEMFHKLQAESYDAQLLAHSISGIGDRDSIMKSKIEHLGHATEANNLAINATKVIDS